MSNNDYAIAVSRSRAKLENSEAQRKRVNWGRNWLLKELADAFQHRTFATADLFDLLDVDEDSEHRNELPDAFVYLLKKDLVTEVAEDEYEMTFEGIAHAEYISECLK